MSERIDLIIAKQNAANAAVSKFGKGGGSIGFGDMDTPPIVSETFEVVGKSYQVKTDKGTKTVTPKARIVVLEPSGEVDVIRGGIGASVSAEDAKRLLDRSRKTKLTKALKPRNSVK